MKDIKSIKESMEQYTGTKTIMATPMSRGEYNQLRGFDTSEGEDANEIGYLVMYQSDGKPNVNGFDGYVSWSPLKPFIENYKKSGRFVDRLIIERDELHKRICKLDEVLRFANRGSVDDDLERIQLDAMKTYHRVLSTRIRRLLQGNTSEADS